MSGAGFFAIKYNPMDKFAFYYTLLGGIQCTYYMAGALIQHPKDNPELYPEYYAEFWLWMSLGIVTMAWSSFILTARLDGGKVERPWEGLANEGVCARWDIPRPPRAHHCSNCKKWTIRLDHHCRWVGNCLGIRNQKIFMIFCLFMSIGGIFHLYLTLCYMFDRSIPDYLGTKKARLFFYYHNGMVIVTSTYGAYMGLKQFWIHVINNVTMIEQFKGARTSWLPFLIDQHDEKAIYYMSSIYNFVQIFGKNPFTWILPVIPDVPFHGMYYPTAPDLLPHQVEKLHKENDTIYTP